jgi:AcrR family transcriptional regulator
MKPKAKHILLKVRHLYQRYGIKSVTMDDIAAHLNISKKTIYEHFRNKQDLVEQVLLLEHDQQTAVLKDIQGRNFNAIEEMFEEYKMIHLNLKEYNHSMEYDVRKYYPELYMKFRELRRKDIHKSSYNNLNKGKKEGLYRKELNSKIIARLHVFRTEVIFETGLFTRDELSSYRIFHELFVYHLQGIMNNKGRRFFDKHKDKFKSSLS